VSPITASRMPLPVTPSHSSASIANPIALGSPVCAAGARDRPEIPPISTAQAYSQPPIRCSAGQNRRTQVLSCSGTSSSARPAPKKCAGTSQPEIANCAANGLCGE